MNFIIRKHISRRAVLRGVGAALALPLLDAMVPAFCAEKDSAAAPVKRLLIVHYPHGVVDDTWNPVGEGTDFKLSSSLAPLARYRDQMLIIRGLTNSPDRAKADFHDRAIASYLTGCELTRGKVQVGTSMDQIAARSLGKETQFASLELSTEPPGEYGSPCYRDANTNLPMERNPRFVFERLFGDTDSLDQAAMARRTADDRSLLDSVNDRLGSLNRQLGASDRRKLDQYTDSIRDIERRIAIASAHPVEGLSDLKRPSGIPDNWEDHVKLMFDLQVLALQADLTRVITFSTTKEVSQRTFLHLGLAMTFHEISHHNGDPTKLDALTKINKNHSELFAYYLDKLDGAKEANGSLLDHSVILYGSDLSNPSVHSQRNLPIIVAGGSAGGIKGGRYVRIPGEDTPLSNLHLALLDKVGVPTDHLGDSTGALNRLEV
jgi:Protein of unknown function (DUF1552)